MTLNDLGQAAYDIERDRLSKNGSSPLPQWDKLSDADRTVVNTSVLAAVELFANEAMDDIRKLRLANAIMLQDTKQFDQAISVIENLLRKVKDESR